MIAHPKHCTQTTLVCDDYYNSCPNSCVGSVRQSTATFFRVRLPPTSPLNTTHRQFLCVLSNMNFDLHFLSLHRPPPPFLQSSPPPLSSNTANFFWQVCWLPCREVQSRRFYHRPTYWKVYQGLPLWKITDRHWQSVSTTMTPIIMCRQSSLHSICRQRRYRPK